VNTAELIDIDIRTHADVSCWNPFDSVHSVHSVHSGIGSGMHPSWPWQDEALSVAMHRPDVAMDLSGWSPKYFPPQLVQYANTLLKDRVLFGSDYPLITPERWMKDFDEAGFKPEVEPLIAKSNALRLLGLG